VNSIEDVAALIAEKMPAGGEQGPLSTIPDAHRGKPPIK
jgi:hypothetical protein